MRVSPRPRGSTLLEDHSRSPGRGFPAPAGIDPDTGHVALLLPARFPRPRGDRPVDLGARWWLPRWFPRARGDRPDVSGPAAIRTSVSPRPRGSTLVRRCRPRSGRGFPAPAGIDPPSFVTIGGSSWFPRARGDRPAPCSKFWFAVPVSPRPRGSTLICSSCCFSASGFPAPAGIDPSIEVPALKVRGFPRARGDRPSPA